MSPFERPVLMMGSASAAVWRGAADAFAARG